MALSSLETQTRRLTGRHPFFQLLLNMHYGGGKRKELVAHAQLGLGQERMPVNTFHIHRNFGDKVGRVYRKSGFRKTMMNERTHEMIFLGNAE